MKKEFNISIGQGMLIPAITRKDEILHNFRSYYYTVDMMYESGSICNWVPNIKDGFDEGSYQFAVVDSDNNLIGYIGYEIDWYVSCASRFAIFSFDRGNPIMGKALYQILELLINDYHLHRIEWRMVGGNPVEKSYDKFCSKYNGTKHILKDVSKDNHGKYHDSIIYEIIR